jgi:serine/threonine protein kinase
MAGSFTGTPMYLAPEGIQTPNKVDHRTDLYAVGAVGYFILTGTPPFTGNSLVEICMHATNDPVDPPSIRLGREVCSDLGAVLLKCLQKDPAQRFQSIEELAAALEQCRSAGNWTPQLARDWWLKWRNQKTIGTRPILESPLEINRATSPK